MSFSLNGAEVTLPGGSSLLLALREHGLNGPRLGCGEEACGACHVLVDGVSVPTCALPVEAVAGKAVITLEGLGNEANPHPLQTAFLAEQAGQCAYCLSGIMISAAGLLAREPRPSEAMVRAALQPHLCRCHSHNRILRAVMRAIA